MTAGDQPAEDLYELRTTSTILLIAQEDLAAFKETLASPCGWLAVGRAAGQRAVEQARLAGQPG